jgi:type IV pilus assembly protein PilW
MTPLPLRRPHGFTLIELMISTAIGAIVLASLFGVVQSQQTAFYQGHLQRAAQSSARSALAFVEQRLATAGYGMDAPLAFDFQYYPAAPCPALAPTGCPRDSVSGSDELVFYARNPRYWVPLDRSGAVQPSGNAWRVTGLSGSSITLSARAGDHFEKGRILQLVCQNGSSYAYVTLAASVPKQAGPTGVTITLVPSVATNPFLRQDAAVADTSGCFTGGGARAFLIDRFRFHVRPVAVGGNEGVRPYLVLDTGLDAHNDGPDEAEEIVVAEGIESFQVGYVMTNSALTPRGTTPGTQITLTAGATGAASANGLTTLQYPGLVNPGQWEYLPTSWYRYAVGPTPMVASERLTDHQANIRAVRIVIVARGPDPDPVLGRPDVLLPILNQNALPSWIPASTPYSRARVETTVPVRNMVARAMNDF